MRENRRLGLARSRDGVRWEKLPMVIAGGEAWDSKVVCDPTVLIENGQVRVWRVRTRTSTGRSALRH